MTGSNPTIVTKNQELPGGADWQIGGILNIDTDAGGKLTVNGVDVTSAVALGGVAGVAAGYKIARGVASVTGATGGDIATGLTTVVGVSAVIEADISLNADRISAAVAAAGHITVKVWKPTATGDCTPILSTTATNVSWVAVGT